MKFEDFKIGEKFIYGGGTFVCRDIAAHVIIATSKEDPDFDWSQAATFYPDELDDCIPIDDESPEPSRELIRLRKIEDLSLVFVVAFRKIFQGEDFAELLDDAKNLFDAHSERSE